MNIHIHLKSILRKKTRPCIPGFSYISTGVDNNLFSHSHTHSLSHSSSPFPHTFSFHRFHTEFFPDRSCFFVVVMHLLEFFEFRFRVDDIDDRASFVQGFPCRVISCFESSLDFFLRSSSGNHVIEF